MNKIEYMPIFPVSTTSKIDNRGVRSRVMVLAHLYDKTEYIEFFKRTTKQRQFTLLDNGAAENNQISDEKLIEVVNHLNPTCVIAPDCLFDKKKTIKNSLNFIEKIKKTNKNIEIMCVPHGKTIEQYIECFDVFNNEENVDWIGISKFVSEKPFTDRVSALLEIDREIDIKKRIHMLGCNNPAEIGWARRMEFVESIDSCICALYGYNNKTLPLDVGTKKREKTPENYFELRLNKYQLALSFENISKLDALCKYDFNNKNERKKAK